MTEPHPAALWVARHGLSPEHVDCATAVMLKILDGKCKMDAAEKPVMAALYDAAKDLPGARLGPDSHAMIRAAKGSDDPALLAQVYEARVLAETRISRPVMKGFKAMLRAEGVLPPRTADEA